MEYFILMFVIFAILVVMKVISQGNEFLQIILFVVWIYSVWRFYPALFSKFDKWKSSPAALLINRIVALIIAGYAYWHVMFKF